MRRFGRETIYAQYTRQRQSCSASQICTYLYIQGVVRLSIKVTLSIPVRAVEQGNECAVDHEPSVLPCSAGVFFDPFLCLLIFFSSWKADDLLHEFRTEDGSHDSARRKDDGTRSNTSPRTLTPFSFRPKRYNVIATCISTGICMFWDALVKIESSQRALTRRSKVPGETRSSRRNSSGLWNFRTVRTCGRYAGPLGS